MIQSTFVNLQAKQDASQESLKIKHTNDIKSLKNFTDTVSKIDLESIVNEIKLNWSCDIAETFNNLQTKPDQSHKLLKLKLTGTI